jgi:FeS assembly SUF system protein
MSEQVSRFREPASSERDAEARTEIEGDTTEERIVSAIRTVYDPEIPVNVYDLGLVYTIGVDDDFRVDITMTLTAPACPVAGILPQKVAEAVSRVDEVTDVKVELVWDPPWSQERMSDEAKLELGLL